MVKELRERTGAGMMECKKALVETSGDMDAAVEQLRTSGQAKADKKSGRVAADGRVVITTDGQKAAMVEINSETDFVAKDDNFMAFRRSRCQRVCLLTEAADIEALARRNAGRWPTVEEARTELVTKVGENISVRRFARIDSGGPPGQLRPWCKNRCCCVAAGW